MGQAIEREQKAQECPICHAVLPVHDGFVTWCDQCGWNINPHDPGRPKNIFEAMYHALGKKQSRALLEKYMRTEVLQPVFTLSKLLGFAVAVAIHGITVVFAAAGCALLVTKWPSILAVAGGLLCIGIAWALRPRFPELSDEVLSRDEFPTLYKLVDTVAGCLGAPLVSGIVVNEHFNGAYGQFGWRRKRILYLGLPC